MPNAVSVNRSRVVAVVSCFHPTGSLIEHCLRLQQQVSHIIVVDDGSGFRADEVLTQVEALGAVIIRAAENSGIGHAMNIGFAAAREHEPEFVVTFDQDSDVPTGFIDALIDEYDRLRAKGLNVGMVAPNLFSGTSQAVISADHEYLEASTVIQSGLLMPISAIDALGPQSEDFFIDLIDTEYFYRAKQGGFVAACVPGLELPHGFGHRLYVHAFGRRLRKRDGRPRMVAVSSPFRYYYRARNRVLLNREFKAVPEIRRVLRQQTRNDLLLDFAVAVYSAKGKWALIRVIFAGWRDGCRGRSGKIPTRVEKRSSKVSWRHPVAAIES